MSIIEAVRKYLQTCPLLKGGTLNVDFLPPEAATYSVDVVPVKPVLKAYMDGSSQRTKRAKTGGHDLRLCFRTRYGHGTVSDPVPPVLFPERRTINETFRTDEESHAEHEL